MQHYDYLIIGGGMTADAAIRGIREVDAHATIGLVSAESDPPYNRPPLSKGLWKGKPLDKIWLKTERHGVEMRLNCHIERIHPDSKRVITEDGEVLSYGKLLLATGGRPRLLPGSDENLLYYRTAKDYRRLRELTERHDKFTVVGGGFIGAEIAAALAMNGKQVRLIIRGDTINDHLFPHEIGQFLNNLYRQKGVELISGQDVTAIGRCDNRLMVKTRGRNGQSTHEFEAEAVVAGIGIVPNAELARDAGLYVDNGIWVDEFLRTSNPNIYAAGDVASFHHPVLGRRRVEHEDNALTMGRHAGRNMAGAAERYAHIPYFYSDLFEVGYEAVGELDADAEKVVDWVKPFEEGTIYYRKDERVRGVLYWNRWGQVDEGRKLILS